MKLTFIKQQGGTLIPDSEEVAEKLKAIPNGQGILIEYKPKRSYRFHKKLFALLNLIYQNQEHYKSVDNILEVVKFRAGHFETIVLHNGNTHYKAKSISFADMNELEFKEFYSKSIDVALELTQMTKADIENEIIRFM